jgi:8-amino-7-oxononanoate synthase
VSSLPWQQEAEQQLQQLKAAGRYRSNKVREGEQGVDVIIDGQRCTSFCSNDYLGLASHPAVKAAFVEAINKEGAGSGAAHLLTGHSRFHQQLEDALCEFTGHQRALLFSTGYMANMGVIDGLLDRGDVIIQDKWNHASLLDGGRISAAEQLRYPHVDMALLHQRLHTAAAAKHKMIATDGVFSMDGDIAPLPEIMALAKQHRAAVLVDDAHAFGVLGEQGKGSLEHWQIPAENGPILMGTFGKALGTAGAFVAADETTIETLIQSARSYVYTTAQPGAVAAATLASLKLVQQESWRREKLAALIQQFHQGAQQLGLDLMPSQTPIQPVLIGDDAAVVALGKALQQRGQLVGVIRPPTVPKGTARLRITLSALHEAEHVEQLLDALEQSLAH